MKIPILRLNRDLIDQELLQSTSRKVIYTTGGIYLVWHFIATLLWPDTFSPSLWIITLMMLLTFTATIQLLTRYFLAAQIIWFSGMIGAILIAYHNYDRPETLLLLALLPLMAEVMTGLLGTAILEGVIIGLVLSAEQIPFLAPMPTGYPLALCLVSLATSALGWGLSDNLISAIEASSYHYREAVRRLEETREHRARISVLLREQTKANYQLNRLNKMLSYARARAEEAREDRDRFTMAVSHELRSPLNFVIGFSDLMVNSPETYGPVDQWPPGLYDDIQEIYRSSKHLLGLINDILDMGKIDANQMVLFKERAQIEEIVATVVDMVNAATHQKGLYLRTEIEPDLPIIYADCTRIRQVLLNLVTNAMRFTTEGGITIRVRRFEDHFLRIEVEDTGTGISPENLEKVFDEFRQVGNEVWRRNQGSGLGLSIARRFIQLHEGEIGAESELGKGSLFYFTLPVQESLPENELLSAEGLAKMARQPELAKPADQDHLLVFLSSNPFWARVFSEKIAGYNVSVIQDPEQLPFVVGQLYPRAAIVDQSLARKESVQQFIKNPPYDLPIISFTFPGNDNQNVVLPSGVIRYLVKPVSRNTLLDAIHLLGNNVRNLLVVDDDPSMVRYLIQTLKSSADEIKLPPECRLHSAGNGREALEIIQREGIDAMLLDLDLPDITGLAVLEQMQNNPAYANIRTIIVSANDINQMFSLNQSGLLELSIRRPFTRQELSDVVQTLVEKVIPMYSRIKSANAAERLEDLPE